MSVNLSDSTSGDTEFHAIDDEYEDIDGMTHLQISSPPLTDTATIKERHIANLVTTKEPPTIDSATLFSQQADYFLVFINNDNNLLFEM